MQVRSELSNTAANVDPAAKTLINWMLLSQLDHLVFWLLCTPIVHVKIGSEIRRGRYTQSVMTLVSTFVYLGLRTAHASTWYNS